MANIPFDPSEIINPDIQDSPRGPVINYHYPVSRKEGYRAFFVDHDPIWQVTNVESNIFCPSIVPDNVARGFVIEGKPYDRAKYGGPDMFGTEWVFVPVAGGSMVKPGNPVMEDVNDWKSLIKMPDLDSWDWAGSHEANKDFLLGGAKANVFWILNGCWFERLISFMDFEEAAVAMIDEDQEDALKELFHELTSLHLKIVDKVVENFPEVDTICIHDDWGSQMAPFFSEAAARNLLLPEMKRFVSYVYSKGLICDLHSCGHVEDRVEIFIEAGFDSWTPMPMNDTIALYEKYGDKIIIGVVYDKPFDPATATEEEQRAAARDFVDRFCNKDKLCTYSNYNNPGLMTPAFREELYKASREKFNK